MCGDPLRAIEIFDRLDGQPYATIRSKWVRVLFRALAASVWAKCTGRLARSSEHWNWSSRSGLPDIAQRHEPVVVAMLADVARGC
jgi:hypothetical protein